MSTTLGATVDRYFDALNREAWEDLNDIFHPDAIVSAVGSRPRTGIAEIDAFFRRMFQPWTIHQDTPGRSFVGGDGMAIEVHFSGQTPDERSVEFDAIDVIDLRGDRIERVQIWYDLGLVQRLLTAND